VGTTKFEGTKNIRGTAPKCLPRDYGPGYRQGRVVKRGKFLRTKSMRIGTFIQQTMFGS